MNRMRQVCGEARRDEAVRSPGKGGSSLARRHVVKADGERKQRRRRRQEPEQRPQPSRFDSWDSSATRAAGFSPFARRGSWTVMSRC
ncbi:hypothetical protein PG995_004117 [Apiospora arundinis]